MNRPVSKRLGESQSYYHYFEYITRLSSSIRPLPIVIALFYVWIPLCMALLWEILQLHHLYSSLFLGCLKQRVIELSDNHNYADEENIKFMNDNL